MPSVEERTHNLLQSRRATIAVVGLGYVGLPLARALVDAGFRVLGLDSDRDWVRRINSGEPVLDHLGADFTANLVRSERFKVVADESVLADADAVLVCVPTPLTPNRAPDLGRVRAAAASIGRHLREGQLIVLESTCAPGTTRQDFIEAIRSACPAERRSRLFKVNTPQSWYAAYAPERVDPGPNDRPIRSVPRVVGGIDAASTRLAASLYEAICETVCTVESPEIAEAAKLIENMYRAVNIALVNEVKSVLTPLGIDVWAAIDAAATKPFGFSAFYPGPGTGGHCIPVDPVYFAEMARRSGVATPLIDSAIAVNRGMPEFVIQTTVRALADRCKPVREARILLLGVAYKPDVDDIRESPALALIEGFERLGAEVCYHDPHRPILPAHGAMPDSHQSSSSKRSIDLNPETMSGFDAVVIVTAHSTIDWASVARHSSLIVDTRGVMRRFASELGERLVHA